MTDNAPVPGRTRRLPAWLRLGIGLGAIAAGLTLAIRPFASVSLALLALSLGLLLAGGLELAGWGVRRDRASWLRWPLGGLYLALGLAVAVLPGLSLRVTVVGVALALLAQGLRHLLAGITGPQDRWGNLLQGAATVIFGVLALT